MLLSSVQACVLRILSIDLQLVSTDDIDEMLLLEVERQECCSVLENLIQTQLLLK